MPAHRHRHPSCTWLGQALIAGVAAVALLVPDVAAAGCDEQGVCVEGAKWSPDATLNDKTRRRARRRNRAKKDVVLEVTLEGERGSVFIDGIWIAPLPLMEHVIKPGRHDIQIRDGARVFASGVVTVPNRGGQVTMVVNAG